jgi:DNA invertase Pin-like site-specific DNA recombinase
MRVSTEDQKHGHSFETQERECRDYAERQGWDVAEVYDDTRSGSLRIEARPGAMRLLADAKAGKIQAVVVWRYDRAFRDTRGLPWFEYELEGAGIDRVHSAMDDIPDGQFRNVMVALTGHQAQQELRNIRERSMAGVKTRVASGKLTPGNRPRFGYQWTDERNDKGNLVKGRFTEDPETAWVVRLIFERIAAGTPKRTLKRELEGRGIPTPRGGAIWSLGTLANLIRNPIYRGEAHAFMYQTKQDKSTGKRRMVPRKPGDVDDMGRVGWTLVDGAAPALVDTATWKRANEALDNSRANMASRYAPDKDPEDVLIRGHVVCAHCGLRLQNHRYADGPYLFCQTRMRDKSRCPGTKIKASILDVAVWERVLWLATDPGLAVAEFKRQAQSERASDDAAQIDAQLRQAEDQQQNLTEALSKLSGPAQLGVIGKLQEISDYRAGLQIRRDEIEFQRLTLERRSQAVTDWLTIWSAELERVRELSYQERRAWLRRLGVEVTVAKPGSELPRYRIDLSIPIEIEESLSRDPDGGFAPWTPELEADYDRWIKLYEQPQPLAELCSTPDTRPRSKYGGSTPSGPYHAVPCADTAGGNPRQGRSGRQARSPS